MRVHGLIEQIQSELAEEKLGKSSVACSFGRAQAVGETKTAHCGAAEHLEVGLVVAIEVI
jgi:hypothetical protein